MLQLHNALVKDIIYQHLPMRPEYWELAELIDNLPGVSMSTRNHMNSLLGNLYCDVIDDAFAIGWQARTDPTFLIFESVKGGE